MINEKQKEIIDAFYKEPCLVCSKSKRDCDHMAIPDEYIIAEKSSHDAVNSPAHYTQGASYGIECIDAMRAQSSPEEFAGYLRLSAVKYLWRFRNKGKASEDLQKAQWFLARLAESVAANDEKEN